MIGRGLGDGGEPIGAVPCVRVPLVYPNAIDARRGGTVAHRDWWQIMLLMRRIFASDRNRMLVMEFAGRHALDPHQTTPGFTRPGDAHFVLFFSSLLFVLSNVTQMRHSQLRSFFPFYSYSFLTFFVICSLNKILVFFLPPTLTTSYNFTRSSG